MTDMTDWEDDLLGKEESDDEIIELTDIVIEASGDDMEDDIIELTDIVEEKTTDSDPDIETEEFFVDEKTPVPEENFSFDEGLELEMDGPADDLSVEPEDDISAGIQDFSVTPEQVEAALERVIEKKFSDKIETILFAVMEKVIEKEIVKIKDNLQKDLDQIGNS